MKSISHASKVGTLATLICLVPLCLSLASCGSKSAVPNYAITSPAIYQNSFMAPNDLNSIHNNAFQTDTAVLSGPGRLSGLTVTQQSIYATDSIGIAGTIAFNASGQIVTLRTAPVASGGGQINTQTLMILAPDSMNVLASLALPSGPVTPGVSFSGGGYFYLNNLDQIVCITFTQEIRVYSTQNNQLVLVKSYPLAAAIGNPDDTLGSVVPDSSGNLWFITDLGKVGYVNPASGAIQITSTSPGEENANSFASDADGRVIIASDHALYAYTANKNGVIELLWRTSYDRGTREKPGQVSQGTGTTPTLFDDAAGNKFVAIADNADPFLHVNVYDRTSGNLVVQQAVFSAQPNTNSTENSLIAVNHTILVENNYGNIDANSTIGQNTTAPGFDRVDFDLTTNSNTGLYNSSVVWSNMDISVPSVVSKLSTGDGLIYTFAKDNTGWYWAALDFNTGKIVSTSYVNTQPFGNVAGESLANNFYAGIAIGPDNVAYVSVLGGFVSWSGSN